MENLLMVILVVSSLVMIIWMWFFVSKNKQYRSDERGQLIMAKAAVPLISVIFFANVATMIYSRFGHLVGSIGDNLILFMNLLVILAGVTHMASVKYYESKL